MDVIRAAEKKTGDWISGARRHRDRLIAIDEASSVQSRLSGLEDKTAAGDTAIVALQSPQLPAKAERVIAANHRQIIVLNEPILRIGQSSSRCGTNTVDKGAEPDLRKWAAALKRR